MSWVDDFPELSALEALARATLEAQGRAMLAPAGHALFHPGDVCQAYLFVTHGSVKVSLVTEDGRDVVLYRVTHGQTCLLTTACLMGEQAYAAEGVAEVDTQAIWIDRAVFERLLDTSAVFRKFVCGLLAKRLGDVLARFQSVAFESVRHRLTSWLMAQPDTIHATHAEIAQELGAAREVISRALKALERDGALQLERGEIHLLDRERLVQWS
jgi:CRP/FNR family transcriptional regulator, anaerobic regulatory protein